ncbi:MAG: IPT/TIG domain-containing protein, partial [Dolichospermum sp.]
TTPGGSRSLAGFTFIPAPTITTFAPTTAAAGAIISITGTNFNNTSAITLGGTPVSSFTIVSSTSIIATVGSGSTGALSLTTPGGSRSLAGFTFIPAPTISDFIPKIAGGGATLTITGTNFDGASTVNVGGTAVTSFTVVSSTSIRAIVGNGSTGNVSVVTPGGQALLAGFTFVKPIISITIQDSLQVFGATKGNYSKVQNYTISGSYLQGAVRVVSADSFEISTSPLSGFGKNVILNSTNGIVDSTKIYVRFKSDMQGTFTGSNIHSSTNAVSQSITVTGNSACDSTVYSTPVINGISKDTIICFKDSILLTPGNVSFSYYKWSTGELTKTITVKGNGTYKLQVGSNSNCLSNFSLPIKINRNTNQTPTITFASDNLISSNSSIYRWFYNNILIPNAKTNIYKPNKVGFYTVETSNDSICWESSIDFVLVKLPNTINKDSITVKVYPNPTFSGLFHVVVNLDNYTNVVAFVTIVDGNGNIVLQTNKFLFLGREIKIPISLSQKGTFFAKIDVNGVLKTITVLIQ